MWHLRDLEFFVSVAEHESFTRAAEALHFAQPALSKRIAGLEREVGMPLFQRGWGGAKLTETGRTLLPYARELLETAARADAAIRNSGHADLTVGFWLAPGGGVLSRAIELFNRRRPGVRVSLRRVDWTVKLAGVADGIANVGLMWAPVGTEFAGIASARLERLPTVMAMPRTHPLAQHTELTPEDLRGQTLLIAPKIYRDSMPPYPWISSMGIDTHEVWTVDEDIECVGAGIGIAPLPGSIMTDYFGRPDIVSVPLRDEQVDLTAVWLPDSAASALIKDFVECFAEAIRSQLGMGA
jgi:DNA-binding transcriptional LysR family regulator